MNQSVTRMGDRMACYWSTLINANYVKQFNSISAHSCKVCPPKCKLARQNGKYFDHSAEAIDFRRFFLNQDKLLKDILNKIRTIKKYINEMENSLMITNQTKTR